MFAADKNCSRFTIVSLCSLFKKKKLKKKEKKEVLSFL